MKWGAKVPMKVYRKPTHAGHYLHFNPNHPHHEKKGAVHSLVNRAKVICQNQKHFNNEIKNIRHDLMFNEYPKEFVDSVMKPSTTYCPSSDIIYQDTVIIPYIKGISEKFQMHRELFQS
jgi:hypothetical protein